MVAIPGVKAGLDEIRFHPPEEIWSMMDRSVFKERIKWSRDNGMSGGSAYSGKLPLGCQLCAKGGKMVLFVSGICDATCFYCPLSEPKKMKDVMYADEMPLKNMKDAIYEAVYPFTVLPRPCHDIWLQFQV